MLGGYKFIFHRVYNITLTTSANANRKTSMSRLEAMVYCWGLVVKGGGGLVMGHYVSVFLPNC